MALVDGYESARSTRMEQKGSHTDTRGNRNDAKLVRQNRLFDNLLFLAGSVKDPEKCTPYFNQSLLEDLTSAAEPAPVLATPLNGGIARGRPKSVPRAREGARLCRTTTLSSAPARGDRGRFRKGIMRARASGRRKTLFAGDIPNAGERLGTSAATCGTGFFRGFLLEEGNPFLGVIVDPFLIVAGEPGFAPREGING